MTAYFNQEWFEKNGFLNLMNLLKNKIPLAVSLAISEEKKLFPKDLKNSAPITIKTMLWHNQNVSSIRKFFFLKMKISKK